MSAAITAAAAAAIRRCNSSNSSSSVSENSLNTSQDLLLSPPPPPPPPPAQPQLSRYESQKRRDWNTFGQYLKNHRPPLALARCSGAHVLEFLRYLDQFGKTKVHTQNCPFFGQSHPPSPCPCPLKQAWGSLDALIGRLRAAFEENGGHPETNPFGARAVRLYLREVKDTQAKARGIAYEKKKRRKPQANQGSHGFHFVLNDNNNNSLKETAAVAARGIFYGQSSDDASHQAMVMVASSNGDACGSSMIPLSVFN